MAITRVALAGASGNIGPAILDALLAANFSVTVLTRASSKHKFPPQVNVVPVDYQSLDSLTEALRGQDAVVCALSVEFTDVNLRLITAAAAAGVKRYIPSEFGSDTSNPNTWTLPMFTATKGPVQKALKEHARREGGMTYTALMTGTFFDWGLQVGFLIGDLKGKNVTIYNGGDALFSTTRISTIGKAVAEILLRESDTANRELKIHEAVVSQNQILDIAKSAKGAEGWTIREANTKEMLAAAKEELKKESPDHEKALYSIIYEVVYGGGYGSAFEETDNELLGIPKMTQEEIEETVKRFV